MVTFSVVMVAHWPASGVKVYVNDPTTEVSILAGFHVPVIPFASVLGSAVAESP